MLGLQPIHLVVVFVVALLVFGPQRLPEIGRGVGKAINEFRRSTQELTASLQGELAQGNLQDQNKGQGNTIAPANSIAPAWYIPPTAPPPAAVSAPQQAAVAPVAQAAPVVAAPGAVAAVAPAVAEGAAPTPAVAVYQAPAPVSAPEPAGNFCISCGQPNPANARFCNQCGTQLTA